MERLIDLLERPRTKLTVIILLVVGLVIALWDLVTLEFNEQFKISNWVVSTLWPLIIILAFPTGFILDYLFNSTTKNVITKLDIRFKSKFRMVFGSFFLGLAMLLLYFAIFQGAVSLTNRLIGQQREHKIVGLVKDFKVTKNQGRENYYVTVYDKELSRDIKLKTKTTYEIGQPIDITVTVGSMGFVYKK